MACRALCHGCPNPVQDRLHHVSHLPDVPTAVLGGFAKAPGAARPPVSQGHPHSGATIHISRDQQRSSSCPKRTHLTPETATEAYQPLRHFVSLEATAGNTPWCPSPFFGAAIYFQQPIHVSSSQGRTQLKQPTLQRGEKEQEEDLHPRQFSALVWPLRRKQSLEGYKGKGPHEYLGITYTMGSGDGEQSLC